MTISKPRHRRRGGDHIDPIGDHERGIEADAELANQLHFLASFGRLKAL